MTPRPATLLLFAAACALAAGCARREPAPDPREAAPGEAQALEDAAAMLAERRSSADAPPAPQPRVEPK